ncbi:M14 metallopeptidase family protein [Marinicella sediminis]|uniref:M14 metallopeptidase family protein n=1 Tax=Marinicella sediminis TaxID=1792834 RepID=A0ABV7JJJ1_9GAMM|nr:M14 metallopeptidase family protein [Marinicella sediminis]
MINSFYRLTALFLLSITGSAIQAREMGWPDFSYQKNIPTIHDVLGHQPGERVSTHAQMMTYMQALAKAAPEQMKVFTYAQTWEGRPLIYVVIGSAAHLTKLPELTNQIQQLSDPRQTDNDAARKLIDSLPASVWLGYGVHGNEISSTDAAMLTAYHLLASGHEPMTQQILDNTLVFIDPLQNPDGRDRFTSRYYSTVGLEPSPDRFSAEHNEPWPSGRTNHYLFDMNRDWLAMTQPETQGRIKTLNQHLPQVVIDVHEMGGDSSYYFAPAAEPFNPLMTADQINNMNLIGKNHAKHFDAMGHDYFTREVFDAFYPGYGDSWPTFYGASASTYEVASARGEIFKRRTGEQYTYAESVQQHFVASVSTIEATAQLRKQLLSDFYQYQVSAIRSGEKSRQRFHLIPKQTDRAGAHKLATLLSTHGIEVQQTTSASRACGTPLPAGSFVIDSAQPRGRMAETMLRQQVDMDPAFIEKQEDRRRKNLRDQIFDLTAWSLPLMFNLDVERCDSVKSQTLQPWDGSVPLTGSISEGSASMAYLVPWKDMAAGRFLTKGLRQGLVIKSTDLPFTHNNGKNYPAGTLIIEVKNNSVDVAETIRQLAEQTGAQVDGVSTSWVIKGPNFGSMNVVTIPKINIAMAWDEPTSSLSAGNTRFVIERQLGYPVTAIRSKHLNVADLSPYDVLILPGGNYQTIFSKSGLSNINDWISDGGVLLTLGQATAYAAAEQTGWLSVKPELAFQETEKGKKAKGDKKATAPGQLLKEATDLHKAIADDQARPDAVAGVLTRVAVDQDHWLTAGVKPEVIALVAGRQIYTPIQLNKGRNVAWFKGPDDLLASGYLWEENRQQLAYKPFLIHQPKGKGMVIAFTQEPTIRAFLDGLQLMLTNTLFRSAAHSAKVRR